MTMMVERLLEYEARMIICLSPITMKLRFLTSPIQHILLRLGRMKTSMELMIFTWTECLSILQKADRDCSSLNSKVIKVVEWHSYWTNPLRLRQTDIRIKLGSC